MGGTTTIAARAHTHLSLNGFENAGIPEEICASQLSPPTGRQYILRMPIRVDGNEFAIPAKLAWLRPMFESALTHQTALGLDHPFCYVTVRHGLVDSETDDEWHVDGFSMKVPHRPEQNYIWCGHTGTEYVPLDVSFPADFDPLRHNVNHFLAAHVNAMLIRACRPQTIYCLDPYLLHRRPAQTAGDQRTFVRISFVPIEIDDVNNSQNPLLPRHYTADGVVVRNRLATYSRPEHIQPDAYAPTAFPTQFGQSN